jgi:hypothetical protein
MQRLVTQSPSLTQGLPASATPQVRRAAFLYVPWLQRCDKQSL